MLITQRQYEPTDRERVGEFLIASFQPGNQDGNWLQPAWEVMFSHPNFDEKALEKISIWELTEEIVGVAHYEHVPGEAFFQLDPEYDHLKPVMLVYARNNLCAQNEDGDRYLRIYINDFDQDFESKVRGWDYYKDEAYHRPVSALNIPETIPQIELPDGFKVKSLAEENDLRKIHRVLWRGFDHAGEPPEEGIEERKIMQSSPYFNEDLTIVVEGPNEDFVAFFGLWYEPTNQIAYVEPAATDPDFRGMGLGKAAIWTGIQRCKELGATVVYVGSDQPFYKAMGFEKLYTSKCWAKRF